MIKNKIWINIKKRGFHPFENGLIIKQKKKKDVPSGTIGKEWRKRNENGKNKEEKS